MSFLRGFAPRTIAGQITGLLVISILLGVGLASAVLLYLVNQGQNEASREIFAAVRAAHIATIAREAQAAHSPEQLSISLPACVWTGWRSASSRSTD